MGLLDFLEIPKWKEVQRGFLEEDTDECEEEEEDYEEEYTENDYWWIDESELRPRKLTKEELKNTLCMQLIEVADSHIVAVAEKIPEEVSTIGEKVAASFLRDRYLQQRRESNPDIFFDYMVQLMFETGFLALKKWKDKPEELDGYIDRILSETPHDEFKPYEQELFSVREIWPNTAFCRDISNVWYEHLKWYYGDEEFEGYTVYALWAVYNIGVLVSSAN